MKQFGLTKLKGILRANTHNPTLILEGEAIAG
jgi:hypothetical protein